MLYHFALLLPCLVCLYWALNFIRHRRTNNKAQNVAAFILILMAFSAFCFVDILTESEMWTWRYIQNIIYLPVMLAIFPLSVRYFRLMTNGDKLKWWNNLLFVPALVILITAIVVHSMMGHESSIQYVRDYLYIQRPFSSPSDDLLMFRHNLFRTTVLCLLFQVIYLLIYAIFSLRHYRQALNNFYSNHKDKGLGANYIVFTAMIIYLILTSISFFIEFDTYATQRWLPVALMSANAALAYVVARCIFNLKFTAVEMAELTTQLNNIAITDDTQIDNKPKRYPSSLPSAFNSLVDDEKLFLQPNLCVDQISHALATNRIYITRMISDLYGMSFFDYINSKRIRYAQSLMLADPQITLAEVVLRTGFGSMLSFYLNFHKMSGHWPKRWLKVNHSKR